MLNYFKFWGNDIIEFYCHPDFHEVIPEPRPAIKSIPDWFKVISPVDRERRDNFNDFAMNAKKCLPMIDAMSLGFIMPLGGDLHVKTDQDVTQIKIHNPPAIKLAEFHDIRQVGGSTFPGYPAHPIKFINHWIVKTAPGWSTLFIPPINHLKTDFTCLGGLVDTDTYPKEVNFPAMWHTGNFDGLVPAGTPLVTAIPIKRNSFDKKPKVRKMTDSEFKKIAKISKAQNTRHHVYTKELREKR